MIPYGRQDINEDDIKAVVEILRSDFITQGSAVPTFENKLCDYTGAKYAIAVNSCTSALHIACLALGLGSGDVLWTSPITFVASANCALYCNATVDFVDIEPDTALMSVENLKEKLEQAEKDGVLPKVVIPVHFAGQSCDMKEIYNLSKQYGFKIIEDAAHAIGAKYQNEIVGNCRYSDITVFSFHPVKIITTGEGGVAMTNDQYLSEKMNLLRSHGITRDINKMRVTSGKPWYYEQIDLGFNYRMTDIQASLGISQLLRLDDFIVKRNDASTWYDNQFSELEVNPLIVKADRESSRHLYVIKINEKENNKESLFRFLINKGIGVNVHYIPLYRQWYYGHDSTLRGAEQYYKEALTIPIFPSISKHEQMHIVESIKIFLELRNS
jgi:UDP-4-amino-4,6-dideoxy-N-acetyl-beta-L-altrosamine transaminase